MDIRDFVPPIISKIISKFLHKVTGSNMVYDSYQSAQRKCITADYNDNELCNMIADKTVIYRDFLIRQPNTLNSTNVFLLTAINDIRSAYSTKSITILDFGGGCGAHFFEMKRFLPETFQLKWIVVETPQMVLSAKQKKIETEELMFRDNLNNLPAIDLVYSSGALQYTSVPYEFLKNLVNIGANFMLFNRMMFNENDKDIITIQRSLLADNGPGPMPKSYTNKQMLYPHTTMSFAKFSSFVLSQYKQVWTFDEKTGSHKIGNEPIIGRGLYYTKASS